MFGLVTNFGTVVLSLIETVVIVTGVLFEAGDVTFWTVVVAVTVLLSTSGFSETTTEAGTTTWGIVTTWGAGWCVETNVGIISLNWVISFLDRHFLSYLS